jgi:four helix bundle protein
MSRELSRLAWLIYKNLDTEEKFIFGKQYVTAVDSIGANIAEGYGRFHYLDKVKFYYNARASLLEAKHWNKLLKEREAENDDEYTKFKEKIDSLHLKLNSFIGSNINKKNSNR